jgi:hypothetical protein
MVAGDRAEHWGQRPHPPHQQAGHVTAPTNAQQRQKVLAKASSTRDPKWTLDRQVAAFRRGLNYSKGRRSVRSRRVAV